MYKKSEEYLWKKTNNECKSVGKTRMKNTKTNIYILIECNSKNIYKNDK